jgi:hypothetical protein
MIDYVLLTRPRLQMLALYVTPSSKFLFCLAERRICANQDDRSLGLLSDAVLLL